MDTQKGFVRQGVEGADGRGALTWTNYRVHHRQLVGSCHTPQGARLEALRQPPGLRRRLKREGLYAYSQLNHADAQHKPTALESIYPSIKNKLKKRWYLFTTEDYEAQKEVTVTWREIDGHRVSTKSQLNQK